MMFKSNLKKSLNAGFTLVELMVVVAIIGILATIAIPQYSKFQAKARQSEAKIQLGAVHASEVSFAAENNSYTACIGAIGYAREGAKLYYTVGFDKNAATGNVCSPEGNQSCLQRQWKYDENGTPNKFVAQASCSENPTETYFLANIGEGSTSIYTDLPAGALSQTVFTVGAAGQILKGSAGKDQWTIDQGKNLVNTVSGLQ